jgi:molecular chaperone GrpE
MEPMEPKDEQELEEPGEEPSEGKLEAGEELETALREASEALEARKPVDEERGDGLETVETSADKMTIEAFAEELQSLTGRYESMAEEHGELENRYVRLQAEFENFRRRSLKERQEAFQYGHQNLVKDLLSAVDNLERAVEHSENSAGGDLQSLLQGVELVLRELLGALGKHGVKVVEPAYEPFDPAVHEAMSQLPDASVPINTVIQVLQKGYQLRDRLLRPARVIVSRAPDEESSSEGAGSGDDDEQ